MMLDPHTAASLLERIEAGIGRIGWDRELDVDLAVYFEKVGNPHVVSARPSNARGMVVSCHVSTLTGHRSHGTWKAPSLTRSTDAAMSLVDRVARSPEHAARIIVAGIKNWGASGPDTPHHYSCARFILAALMREFSSAAAIKGAA